MSHTTVSRSPISTAVRNRPYLGGRHAHSTIMVGRSDDMHRFTGRQAGSHRQAGGMTQTGRRDDTGRQER